jgi:hypothetical protein
MRSFCILQGMPRTLAANPTEEIIMADTVKKAKATAAKTTAPKTTAAKTTAAKAITIKAAAAKETAKPVTTEAKNGKVAQPSKLTMPSRAEIEKLAKRYWAQRGYQDGYAEQDWLRAEQELLQRAS